MGRRRGRERPPFLLCPLERTSTSSSLFSPLVFFSKKTRTTLPHSFFRSLALLMLFLSLSLFTIILCVKKGAGGFLPHSFLKKSRKEEKKRSEERRGRDHFAKKKKNSSLFFFLPLPSTRQSLSHTLPRAASRLPLNASACRFLDPIRWRRAQRRSAMRHRREMPRPSRGC